MEMKINQDINIRFKKLLDKFNAGDCSISELIELEKFFQDEESVSAIKDEMFLKLENQSYPSLEKFSQEQTFQKVKNQIKTHPKSKKRVLKRYGNILVIAASVILAFVFGVLVDELRDSKPVTEIITYSEVFAPLGAKSKVVLPDSSVVWLNAGSKIVYSSDFNKHERNVSLEGEGYFQVAKNKTIPFVVDAFGLLVEAVGTEFNIEAYGEEQTIKTTMVEGKVKLGHTTEKIAENVFLNPRYKATFYKNSDSDMLASGQPRLVISPNVDPLPLISWKDDRYIFKSELLKDLAVKLGRKYNFTFLFEAEAVKNYRFTGTLEDETLQQVMEVIKITSPISYEISGKVVTITADMNRTKFFKKNN